METVSNDWDSRDPAMVQIFLAAVLWNTSFDEKHFPSKMIQSLKLSNDKLKSSTTVGVATCMCSVHHMPAPHLDSC
jgi:hypothetical protein